MSPEGLVKLATLMGYRAHIDAPAGYGVTRVIVFPSCGSSVVFNPGRNDEQAVAVLCWLINEGHTDATEVGERETITPASLRAKLLDRVAEIIA